MVLIDNVQEAAGRRLMESVLRNPADGRADQVPFFAGLRGQGHPALRNAARRTLPEMARTCGWTPGATPSSRALLIPLPPLSPEGTLRTIGASCPSVPPPSPNCLTPHTG
ncbi:hypothetical protein WBG99_14045 [Streptomyces sp. TG1A-60]|uniref:hypothetical protein n=1 Tax=Streptomyces sp. TG1A-60 TaxID=3129111 RepID=UPI0030CA9236